MYYSLIKPRRMFSTFNKIPKVCIVGAGPAGFYTAMHLTKKIDNINIDIIEKLPVPFGLIRYGVAPDHPEVKNVINQFTKVAQKPNVNFYGNITFGQDVNLSQLRRNYDAVLLTYGAEEDKMLGIENETVDNVVAARKFVGWYNGLPSEKDFKIDLSDKTAVVLGQGNVALDVSRILLSPIDELRKTDIPQHVLDVLSQSKVSELYLVGRRGPLQVAFTIKELREQLKLPNCKTVWRENDFKDVENIASSLPRPRKRLTELMLKSFKERNLNGLQSNVKYFKPVFHRSPEKFLINSDGKLTGVQLIHNKMIGTSIEDQKCIPTDEKEILNCGLVLRSIGYRSVKAEDTLAVDSNGIVINENGRVFHDNDPQSGKLYVAGWLGTGPVGVILNTMGNAFQVAKLVCEDLEECGTENKGGFEEIRKIIPNSTKIVDWQGWEKIDKYEVTEGKKLGKPREKICCYKKMLEIASS